MPPTITARDRVSLLAAALSKVDDADLRAAIDRLGSRSDIPRVVVNAANALRRSRAVSAAVARPPYRAALPYVATAVADDCLARTVEVLGDNSDDPTREQLAEALDVVRESFSDSIIAVMLAAVVADDAMPAAGVCLDIATSDERFGLTDWEPAADDDDASRDVDPSGEGAGPRLAAGGDGAHEDRGASAEQRATRRARRRAVADDRRRRQENAERATARIRSARKQERAVSSPPRVVPSSPDRRSAPALVRQPSLSPAQREEFDTTDPLVGAVVVAWVPFDRNAPDDGDAPGGGRSDGRRATGGEGEGEVTDDAGASSGPGEPESEGGKVRPCVVIGVSADHLLVRPGYSEGGRKSRDWTSVPVSHWQAAGLDQPTWIGVETVRVPRPELTSAARRLSVVDWNALW
jgi:hypothetical protein